MDGWSLCREIKKKPGLSSIPLILLYLSTEKDEEQFREMELKYALDRPDDITELMAIMREIFPSGKIDKTKIKLLMVEDDRVILNIVKSLFELEGYKVFTALNPYQALKILEERNYEIDLILSDVSMPKMDGISFFLKLKEKEETKNIPVIMLTSKDQFEDIKIAYEIGVTEYISKPFDPVELLKKVEIFLTEF